MWPFFCRIEVAREWWSLEKNNENYQKSVRKITHMWRRWGTPQNFFWHLLMNFEKPKFWENEKNWWRYCIILHVYQKPQSHEVQFLRFRVSFGPFFALLPWKPKFWKNEKSISICHHFKIVQQKRRSYDVCLLRYEIWKKCIKHLEILSFYTCVS